VARAKATITIDRAKLERAKALMRVRTMSEAIDIALDRLIDDEQLRHDVAAYSRQPLAAGELALGDLPVELDLDDDDVDYEAFYGDRR